MQAIELSESQQDFARCIGYEVALKDGGTGINLGLYFPDTWAADGIIKPNGVNVFFPDQNKIFVQNFGQVELIFPKEQQREFRSPIADALVYAIPNTKHTSCCLDKAKDDEPIFVLLARDIMAPYTVAEWVAFNQGIQPFEKLVDALKVAEQMNDWRNARIPKTFEETK